jgi:hypothetical protein
MEKHINRTKIMKRENSTNLWTEWAAANSTYPKGGVSCSKDSLVVNQTLVFQIKFCGKSPALRVVAKRYTKCLKRTIQSLLTNH